MSRAAETSARRQAVLAAARDLFAEKGYKATTVRDIADAAGVLSGSLYHYFDSKETLIDEMLSRYLDELIASYRVIVAEGGDAPGTLARLVTAAFATFDQHRAAIIVLQNERHQLALMPRFAHLIDREAEVESLFSGVIRRGKTRGELRRDVDVKVAYRFIRDGIWAAGRWYTPGGRLTAHQLTEQFIHLFLTGLRPL